jgi:hypothetical protein
MTLKELVVNILGVAIAGFCLFHLVPAIYNLILN